MTAKLVITYADELSTDIHTYIQDVSQLSPNGGFTQAWLDTNVRDHLIHDVKHIQERCGVYFPSITSYDLLLNGRRIATKVLNLKLEDKHV